MKRIALVPLFLLPLLFFACDQTTEPETTEPVVEIGVLGLEDVSVQAAVRAQQSVTPGLMAVPGVVGTAVGLGSNGEPVVMVLLRDENAAVLPSHINGVPVESLVTGEFFALQEARVSQEARVGPRAKPTCGKRGLPACNTPGEDPPGLNERWDRPVPIGVSTGHLAITAGTLGARVVKNISDVVVVYALSNNHVYANENDAITGDPVIQPGTFDDGQSTADDIGTLASFVPIDFTNCANGGANVIDAAIALTTTALVGNSTPVGYGTPRSTTIEAAVNMKVKKVGRTTGFTKGRVLAVNATVNIGYSTGVACFVGQIIVTPGSFSAGGDSGSLVVVDGKGRDTNDDRKPVGLLYAGSATQTVLNPIGPVLSAFGVTIDGN